MCIIFCIGNKNNESFKKTFLPPYKKLSEPIKNRIVMHVCVCVQWHTLYSEILYMYVSCVVCVCCVCVLCVCVLCCVCVCVCVCVLCVCVCVQVVGQLQELGSAVEKEGQDLLEVMEAVTRRTLESRGSGQGERESACP